MHYMLWMEQHIQLKIKRNGFFSIICIDRHMKYVILPDNILTIPFY